MKFDCKFYAFSVVLSLSLLRSSGSNSLASISNPQAVDACAAINCGQGTCRPDSSLPGFQCDCYPGWENLFQIAPFTACIIPDCTLNFSCGTPSPPSTPPSFNWSNPCTFTWCGDGNCASNGVGYKCNCNAGSDNLLNITTLPCFKECSLGARCHGVGLGAPPPLPPPPPSDSNSSPPNKLSISSHGLRELRMASTTMLISPALVLLPWL